MRLSDAKVGDKVKLPRAGCSCCLDNYAPENWETKGKATTIATILENKNGVRLLGWTDHPFSGSGARELTDEKWLPYKFGLRVSSDYRCSMVESAEAKATKEAPKPEEVKPITIENVKVGDIVRVSAENLKGNGNGYEAGEPLEAVVICINSSSVNLAWQATEVKSVSPSRIVSNVVPDYPKHTQYITVMKTTPCEITGYLDTGPKTAKTLKDTKVGDLLRISAKELKQYATEYSSTADPFECIVLESSFANETLIAYNGDRFKAGGYVNSYGTPIPCNRSDLPGYTKAFRLPHRISVEILAGRVEDPTPKVEAPKAAPQEEKKLVIKKLNECKPGDQVRISVAEIKRSNGTAEVPLEGTVIKSGGAFPWVAWKDDEVKEIKPIRSVKDADFPELTGGLDFWQNTEVELLVEVPAKEDKKVEEKVMPTIKQLSEFKIGDQIKIEASALSATMNGYHTEVPLYGTIIQDKTDGRGFPCVAWKAGSAEGIDFIRDVQDANFPELTRGIFLLKETNAELVKEAQVEPVKEASPPKEEIKQNPEPTKRLRLDQCKLGDKVRLSPADLVAGGAYNNIRLETIEATVVRFSGQLLWGGCMCLAWEPEKGSKNSTASFSDPDFPTLTRGIFLLPGATCELIEAAAPKETPKEAPKAEVKEAPKAEVKKPPTLKDFKPGDKVRVTMADLHKTTGNWKLGANGPPLEATIITYKGQEPYSGCRALAWDPEKHQDDRHKSVWSEEAFPTLTTGLFVVTETPCELIEAAPVKTVGDLVVDKVKQLEGETEAAKLKVLVDALDKLEKSFQAIDTKIREIPDATFLQDIIKQVIVKTKEEEEERTNSALSELMDILDESLGAIEPPERIINDVDPMANAKVVFPPTPSAKKSSQAGFLLAIAAAGVGLSGLAASAAPKQMVSTKAQKKSRKKIAQKEKTNAAQR